MCTLFSGLSTYILSHGSFYFTNWKYLVASGYYGDGLLVTLTAEIGVHSWVLFFAPNCFPLESGTYEFLLIWCEMETFAVFLGACTSFMIFLLGLI